LRNADIELVGAAVKDGGFRAALGDDEWGEQGEKQLRTARYGGRGRERDLGEKISP